MFLRLCMGSESPHLDKIACEANTLYNVYLCTYSVVMPTSQRPQENHQVSGLLKVPWILSPRNDIVALVVFDMDMRL